MTPQERQQALNKISAEDLAKIKAHQASTEGAYPVDNEWLLLAEFGKAYGWEAYKDARDDNIGAPEMLTLIEANRKLEAIQLYQSSYAAFTGAISAKSKNQSSAFKSMTKDIIRQTKVHE